MLDPANSPAFYSAISPDELQVILLLYLVAAIPLAFNLEKITSYLGRSLGRRVFSNQARHTYWSVVGFVKRRRIYAIVALSFITAAAVAVSGYLLALLAGKYQGGSSYQFLLALGLFGIVYILFSLSRNARIPKREEGHPSLDRLKRIIETQAIAAG